VYWLVRLLLRLAVLLRQTLASLGGEVVELAVKPDHVHLFARLETPYWSPVQIAHRLKGTTSRILRQEFLALRRRLPCLWGRSYCVGTVGHVSKETVERYIASQEGR
jgi:putative transposase